MTLFRGSDQARHLSARYRLRKPRSRLACRSRSESRPLPSVFPPDWRETTFERSGETVAIIPAAASPPRRPGSESGSRPFPRTAHCRADVGRLIV